jgi:thiosulfate dehydrogenase
MRQRLARRILIALSVVTAVALTLGLARLGAQGSSPQAAVSPKASPGKWRVVTACDQRKTVVVEGYADNHPLPPPKARQVASLLTDLMQYCSEEVNAKITSDERIFLSVNGSAYAQYVPGRTLPLLLASGGKQFTPRDQAIWKAELTRTVNEGNKLFHNSKLGTNGISCDMCHPNASNTHPETYPKFQTQLKKVALLRDMINWCIENPLEGKKLAEDDPQMKSLEAYILSQRAGTTLEAGKH